MKILLDTNILVYAHNRLSPQREKACRVIEKAMQEEFHACITPQVIYEFYAVITNPKRVESALSTEEAVAICRDFLESQTIEKVHPTGSVANEVFRYVADLKLARSKIFDCVLALTARENEIETIYTENIDDFKVYRFLKCINPLR